jgi:hypothetical protein
MKIHRFNQQGIEAFRNELQRCRENTALRPDVSLLENETFTEIVADVDLQPRIFQTKGEAGLFLRDMFQQCGLTNNELMSDIGLWSWLSLFYFNSVCPKGTRVKSDYWYIYAIKGPYKWHALIHSLFVSWRVMEYAGNYHQLISTTPIGSGNKFTEQVMKRLFLLRIPCIFETLEKIYWDPKEGKIFPRIVSDDVPGNICNRFPAVIQQLSLTYDMPSLTADKLIELLGDEFQLYQDKAVTKSMSTEIVPAIPDSY